MTDTLRAGTALVSIVGRGFGPVAAVHETLTDAFAYAGPMRDQITEDGMICRALVLRISGHPDERAQQTRLPAVPFDAGGLDPRQARVRVAAVTPDDWRAVTAVISAAHPLVGEPALEPDGTAVLVVTVT
ncbi:hypothetical protein CTU88_31750 [Streptomyces sp. JV178]|jgi:hypothetical protein|uniref:hypothetical protein n=1 Tax=unclassified Streptomyces TaxID=2593676 RepID=UPI000C1B45AA|nr:hypothetical protein [Streptomyces sp. JV178]PIM68664.1 hypothetical protein CTU88_31750 [Streptomyces sp. JV178]